MRRLLPLLAGGLMAAEPYDTLDRLQQANRLRADLAREQAAHATEMQRLEALRSAAEATAARSEAEAQAAEERAAVAARSLAATAPEALETLLAQGVDRLEAALASCAVRLPPGTMPPAAPGGAAAMARCEAAVLRLEAAERAAATVDVRVCTGRLPDGTLQAVKLLRVGGTARWWIGLDGSTAGCAAIGTAGGLTLQPRPALLAAIAAAIAQAEGREAPGIVSLPAAVPP